MSAADSSVPVGFAMPRPAMSGAEPCTDSKYAQRPSPKLAEGATPRPPATSPATSDRISAYWFMHTTTSMVFGKRMIRRAASSTWKCSNARSGYVATVSLTIAWNSPSVCGSTLDFVTQVTLPAWPRAGPRVHLPAEPADHPRRRRARGAEEHGVRLAARALRVLGHRRARRRDLRRRHDLHGHAGAAQERARGLDHLDADAFTGERDDRFHGRQYNAGHENVPDRARPRLAAGHARCRPGDAPPRRRAGLRRRRRAPELRRPPGRDLRDAAPGRAAVQHADARRPHRPHRYQARR